MNKGGGEGNSFTVEPRRVCPRMGAPACDVKKDNARRGSGS